MTAMGSRQHMVMIDPVSFIDVVPASEEKIHTMLFGLGPPENGDQQSAAAGESLATH